MEKKEALMALTESDVAAIDAMRDKGHAVVVFTEDELGGACAEQVETRLIELGWDVISAMPTA